MKRGQTIVAEREKVETASERMLIRKKTKRKRAFAIVVVSLVIVALSIAGVIIWKQLMPETPVKIEATVVEPKATIVDEATGGTKNNISNRIKEYVANFENDLNENGGYKVVKASLPAGKNREIYMDIENRPYYFKISTDRGAGVSAEDTARIIKYLDSKNIKPAKYVDVRVEGKAFYL